ncbi:MAG: hypothetical protein PHO79_01470 [Desulfoplanes sp.]|nr:hypothetical protein [Desulfoplanes sp.]
MAAFLKSQGKKVDTGDRLLQAVIRKDLTSLDMPEKTKVRLDKLLVVKPLPFVKTVIFFSTPHRGSFQSKAWNRSLVRWLISLSANIITTAMASFDYMTDDVKQLLRGSKTIITSVQTACPRTTRCLRCWLTYPCWNLDYGPLDHSGSEGRRSETQR